MASTFSELFVVQLQKLHDIEMQHFALLPDMIGAAASPELRQALQKILDETHGHLARLDQIFGELGLDVGDVNCPTMDGLLQECRDLLDDGDEVLAVRDAALLAFAQCVEHHEIAEYGTCRTYAQQLGFHRAADLLQETLGEESAADQKLTLLAEGSLFHSGINARAGEIGV